MASIVHVEFQSAGILRRIKELQDAYGRRAVDAVRTQVHQRAADLIQQAMADRVQAEVRSTGRPQEDRPDHHSGALVESIMSNENRRLTPGGFVVGLPDYLNRSPAKRYWRQIDRGAPERVANGIPMFLAGSTLVPARPSMFRADARMPIIRRRGLTLLASVIGPFPAYQWIDAGVRKGQTLDYYALYASAFQQHGITLTKGNAK